jgi:hypothetical protein
VLTERDAPIGTTPKDPIWTHRTTTLWRYRSSERRHAVPIVLVFALINRPDIFDLRPGNSFVQFLLEEGFDVFLLDWGVPDDERRRARPRALRLRRDPVGAARGPARRRAGGLAARMVHRRDALPAALRARARLAGAQPRRC